MTEYVAGFLFDGYQVALVVKNRPSWQAGRMNGIGGHIEAGETAREAMAREFREETGCSDRILWKKFAVLSGSDFVVNFFYSYGNTSKLKTTTDEKIVVVPISEINVNNSIPNLTWLIPMAKSMNCDNAEVFYITEES